MSVKICLQLMARVLTWLLIVSTTAPVVGGKPTTSQIAAGDRSERRTPWTTSQVKGTPDPPLPYTSEIAFPNVRFDKCLDMAAVPGTDRILIAQQNGQIVSLINDPNTSQVDEAIHLGKAIPEMQQCYAIAIDPQFDQHRYCYVCYVEQADKPLGTHIARFRVSKTQPPRLEADSEKTIIRWRSGGHNGCCLKFGPDGLLYISAGDAGPANPPDPLRSGQDVTNLLSTIMRIDVRGDDFPGDDQRNYRIPADNPFVGQQNARDEIWAFGLRNPWRMSFDARTGDLWVGDVGWELWEMIHRVVPGGNYGWSIVEGHQAVHPEWEVGPTPILPPTIEHPHSESSSITDGLTYYGDRLPALHGAHLYGDYDTGKVWSFRWNGHQVIDHCEIADTTLRIVSFGETLSGEFFMLDYAGGHLHRLVPNPQQGHANRFPRKLSETGLFQSVATSNLQSAPGVYAYQINAEAWADHASAERWLAVPKEQTIDTRRQKWGYPDHTVFVKTLSMEMTVGEPQSRRLIETQLLHYDGTDWHPYTYRWNETGTEANLVDAGGENVRLKIKDTQAPQGQRVQSWRFAGRAECQRCHNRWSGPALGFSFAQLDRQLPDGSNQLERFSRLSLISGLPADRQRVLVDPTCDHHDLNDRARAYLHVNCAHCHRLHAGSAVLSKMPFHLPLSETEMIQVRPTQGTFGIRNAHVITAGNPYRSVLWYRMAKLGRGHMPHLGSNRVHVRGLNLIHDWIEQLPEIAASFDAKEHAVWQPSNPGTSGSQQSESLQKSPHWIDEIAALASRSSRNALIKKHLNSPADALRLMHAIDSNTFAQPINEAIIRLASNHPEPAIRNLFLRFVPAEQREQHLGQAIDPDAVLLIEGDAQRGASLFFSSKSLQCRNCHRVPASSKPVATLQSADSGEVPAEQAATINLGPDLAGIGKRYRRDQLLETLLAPSREIAPEYVPYLVETSDGRVWTGLLISKSDHAVAIRSAQGEVIRVRRDQIEQLVPQQRSLMPDGQLKDLTNQQVADLLAFLSSLK